MSNNDFKSTEYEYDFGSLKVCLNWKQVSVERGSKNFSTFASFGRSPKGFSRFSKFLGIYHCDLEQRTFFLVILGAEVTVELSR